MQTQINHPYICSKILGLASTSPTLKKNFPCSAGGKGKRKREQRAKGEKRKGLKSSPGLAHNTKTNIEVVAVAPIVAAANRRTT